MFFFTCDGQQNSLMIHKDGGNFKEKSKSVQSCTWVVPGMATVLKLYLCLTDQSNQWIEGLDPFGSVPLGGLLLENITQAFLNRLVKVQMNEKK